MLIGPKTYVLLPVQLDFSHTTILRNAEEIALGYILIVQPENVLLSVQELKDCMLMILQVIVFQSALLGYMVMMIVGLVNHLVRTLQQVTFYRWREDVSHNVLHLTSL